MTNFYGYIRVSTQSQSTSHLGIEAQEAAIRTFISDKDNLLGIFVEVESGKNDNRIELHNALAACKKQKATLCIAKLDRLSRRVSFVSKIMETGVDFVAVDNPHANKLTLHILSAMAEWERDCISQRTAAALQAKKARGEKVGRGPELAAQKRAKADDFAESLRAHLDTLVAQNLSLNAMAKRLNDDGIPTPNSGSQWFPQTVKRVMERVGR